MPPDPATAEKPAAAKDEKRQPPMVVTVRSNRGNVSIPLANEQGRIIGDLQLAAGPNLVPLDQWEAAKRQPMVRILLAEKIVAVKALEQNHRVVGRTVLEEGKPVPAAAPLSALDDTAAIELVKDVADDGLLARLLKVESRAPVRRAIEARALELRDPAKAASLAEAAAGSTKATITMS